jgi:hypothetical protein
MCLDTWKFYKIQGEHRLIVGIYYRIDVICFVEDHYPFLFKLIDNLFGNASVRASDASGRPDVFVAIARIKKPQPPRTRHD